MSLEAFIYRIDNFEGGSKARDGRRCSRLRRLSSAKIWENKFYAECEFFKIDNKEGSEMEIGGKTRGQIWRIQ